MIEFFVPPSLSMENNETEDPQGSQTSTNSQGPKGGGWGLEDDYLYELMDDGRFWPDSINSRNTVVNVVNSKPKLPPRNERSTVQNAWSNSLLSREAKPAARNRLRGVPSILRTGGTKPPTAAKENNQKPATEKENNDRTPVKGQRNQNGIKSPSTNLRHQETRPAAEKENNHKTPVKENQNDQTMQQKRTPLADMRESSTSAGTCVTPPRPTVYPLIYNHQNITQRTQRLIIPALPMAPEYTPRSPIHPGSSIRSGTSLQRQGKDPESNKRQRLLDEYDTSPKKLKIRGESVYDWPQSPSFSSDYYVEKTQLKGFSNIGNTCYMNSILQALFGLDSFAKELTKVYNVFETRIPQNSLFNCLPTLLSVKDADNQDLKTELLRCVKEAISSTATRFLGNEQHDAHEFLAQVLDQLKEEISKLQSTNGTDNALPNPVQSNFEFLICHYIECQNCNDVSRREEQFNDLALELPPPLENDDKPLPLQSLLNRSFKTEQIDHRCEKCGSNEATISRKITRLPRILTMHLKRYHFRNAISGHVKIDRSIDIPRYLTLHRLCGDDTTHSTPITESTKKISIRMSPRLLKNNDPPSRSIIAGGGTLSAEKARRQLFNGKDEEKSESSTNLRQYSFRPSGSLYNTRSASSLLNRSTASDEMDETTALKEVLERSKHDTGPPPEYGDNDPEFRQQLEEAKRLSLLEANGHDDSTGAYPADNGTNAENEDDFLESEDVEFALNAEDGHLRPSYRLCGLVNHLGVRSGSGHYVADVFNISTSKWRSYDDSIVTEIQEDELRRERQRTGYIFFYMAKEQADDLK